MNNLYIKPKMMYSGDMLDNSIKSFGNNTFSEPLRKIPPLNIANNIVNDVVQGADKMKTYGVGNMLGDLGKTALSMVTSNLLPSLLSPVGLATAATVGGLGYLAHRYFRKKDNISTNSNPINNPINNPITNPISNNSIKNNLIRNDLDYNIYESRKTCQKGSCVPNFKNTRQNIVNKPILKKKRNIRRRLVKRKRKPRLSEYDYDQKIFGKLIFNKILPFNTKGIPII